MLSYAVVGLVAFALGMCFAFLFIAPQDRLRRREGWTPPPTPLPPMRYSQTGKPDDPWSG